MYEGKKVIVVMPAYKAALTLEKTYQEIPHDWVDEVILVDDYSPDNTVEVAKKIGIKLIGSAMICMTDRTSQITNGINAIAEILCISQE